MQACVYIDCVGVRQMEFCSLKSCWIIELYNSSIFPWTCNWLGRARQLDEQGKALASLGSIRRTRECLQGKHFKQRQTRSESWSSKNIFLQWLSVKHDDNNFRHLKIPSYFIGVRADLVMSHENFECSCSIITPWNPLLIWIHCLLIDDA